MTGFGYLLLTPSGQKLPIRSLPIILYPDLGLPDTCLLDRLMSEVSVVCFGCGCASLVFLDLVCVFSVRGFVISGFCFAFTLFIVFYVLFGVDLRV